MADAHGTAFACPFHPFHYPSSDTMWPTCLLLLFFQVFLLLVTEMLIFCALIVPLPFTWRRKLFTFISESPIIAKLQYGMKV